MENEKCAKLHSPRRLVQFWHIFQISLVVLIINCTPSRVITYTNIILVNLLDSDWLKPCRLNINRTGVLMKD